MSIVEEDLLALPVLVELSVTTLVTESVTVLTRVMVETVDVDVTVATVAVILLTAAVFVIVTCGTG